MGPVLTFLHSELKTVEPGVPTRLPVVDGQTYEVHAHQEGSAGSFESEPHIFTATTGTTAVRLRPNAPPTLHD